jgi:hypothetical protein
MAPNDEFNYLMERLSKLATKAFVKDNDVRTVAVVSLHDGAEGQRILHESVYDNATIVAHLRLAADLLEKKEKAA